MVGRPSAYSEEIARDICLRLMEGESLLAICADEAMPARSSVYLWLHENSEFSDKYARAREVQATTFFDEVHEISDNTMLGEKRTIKPDGAVEVVQSDMIEHRRLRVDSRKWMAAKLAPRKYGDKLDVEHSGNLTVVVNKPA